MPITDDQGAAEPQDALPEALDAAMAYRFKVACRLLRNSGAIDAPMPGQRRGESQIDWLVRIGIAVDKYAAAEGLIACKRRTNVLIETIQLLEAESAAAGGDTPGTA